MLSLKHARELDPFFKGYAYETLARAEMKSNNRIAMRFYLDKAHELAGHPRMRATSNRSRKTRGKRCRVINFISMVDLPGVVVGMAGRPAACGTCRQSESAVRNMYLRHLACGFHHVSIGGEHRA